MPREKEVRTYQGRVELRSNGAGGSVLKGYASVFNQETRIGSDFVEVVRPGAFIESIEADDIVGLWNHSDDRPPLGRTSAGTLRLEEDSHGLRMEIDAPRSAADIVEAVERKDISAMSFGFTVPKGGDRWTDTPEGRKRELIKVRLLDVSPVVWPAYIQTTISSEARRMAQKSTGLAAYRRRLQDIDDEIRTGHRREIAKLRARLNAIPGS